jgi:hypothetical protein
MMMQVQISETADSEERKHLQEPLDQINTSADLNVGTDDELRTKEFSLDSSL